MVPDLSNAYKQLEFIKPWLDAEEEDAGETDIIKKDKQTSFNSREKKQKPKDRAKLDGKWECVLCFCCTTSCPSYWWNSEEYLRSSCPSCRLQDGLMTVEIVKEKKDLKKLMTQ